MPFCIYICYTLSGASLYASLCLNVYTLYSLKIYILGHRTNGEQTSLHTLLDLFLIETLAPVSDALRASQA